MLCSTPSAEEKINQIKTSILEKNEPVKIRLAEVTTKISLKQEGINKTKERITSLKGIYSNKKFGVEVNPAGGSSAMPLKHAAQIADFIKDGSVPGVNIISLDTKKKYDEWEWLSEMEKEELMNSISR